MAVIALPHPLATAVSLPRASEFVSAVKVTAAEKVVALRQGSEPTDVRGSVRMELPEGGKAKAKELPPPEGCRPKVKPPERPAALVAENAGSVADIPDAD